MYSSILHIICSLEFRWNEDVIDETDAYFEVKDK